MNSRPTSDRRNLAIGSAATSAVNLLKIALQLVLLPLLARLLGPEEFGVFALAVPTVTLIVLLADGGIGTTLAKEDESATEIWSSAFWAMLFLGIVLAALTAGTGVLIGHAVQSQRVAHLIALLSLCIIFLTVSVVPGSRLARRKNLIAPAQSELVATLTGAVVAVTLAFWGAGAWSLAAQFTTTYALRAVMLNFFAFQMPKLVFNYRTLRPHLISGGFVVGSRVVDYAGRVAENFLVNRAFGTALLGNYNLASTVSKFATDSFGSVAWTVLYVDALTTERERVAALHVQVCRLLSLALFPLTFIAAAAAPAIVPLVLGPGWSDCATLLQVFLPGYAFTTVFGQSGAIMFAHHRANVFFWCSVLHSGTKLLAIGLAFYFGFQVLLYGLAAAMLVFCAAMLVFDSAPLRMLRAIAPAAISATLAAILFVAITYALPSGPIWIAFALGASLLAYLVAIFAMDHRTLRQDWLLAQQVFQKRRPT